MKNFRKSFSFKKDSNPSSNPITPTAASDVSKSIDFIRNTHEREMAHPQALYRRTDDDDSLFINQAQVSNSSTPDIPESTPTYDPAALNPQPLPITSSVQPTEFKVNQYIIQTIDKMNMGPIGEFLKAVLTGIITRLLASKYINSEPSSQIHIQSFLYGVVTMSLVMFISPFISVYLDSWVVLLIKLFKHLAGWLVVGFTVSYVIKSKQHANNGNLQSQQTLQPYANQPPPHKYEQLQYSVKPSPRPTTPQRKTKIVQFNQQQKQAANQQQKQAANQLQTASTPPPPRALNRPRPLPSNESPTKGLMIMDSEDRQMTRSEGEQVLTHRPVTNYDKFINAANEKERREREYVKFVSDTTKRQQQNFEG